MQKMSISYNGANEKNTSQNINSNGIDSSNKDLIVRHSPPQKRDTSPSMRSSSKRQRSGSISMSRRNRTMSRSRSRSPHYAKHNGNHSNYNGHDSHSQSSKRYRSRSPVSRQHYSIPYTHRSSGSYSSHHSNMNGRDVPRAKPPMIDRFNPARNDVLAVFGLDRRANEQDLFDLYKKYGCRECKIIIDKHTGNPKGYGFVYFNRVEDAVKAKHRTDGEYVLSKPIRVDYSIGERDFGHSSAPSHHSSQSSSSTYNPHKGYTNGHGDHGRNGRSRSRTPIRSRSRSRSRGRYPPDSRYQNNNHHSSSHHYSSSSHHREPRTPRELIRDSGRKMDYDRDAVPRLPEKSSNNYYYESNRSPHTNNRYPMDDINLKSRNDNYRDNGRREDMNRRLPLSPPPPPLYHRHTQPESSRVNSNDNRYSREYFNQRSRSKSHERYRRRTPEINNYPPSFNSNRNDKRR